MKRLALLVTSCLLVGLASGAQAQTRTWFDFRIGIGGGSKDEEMAYEALTAVVGPQPALAPNMPPAPAPAK